MSFHFQDTNYLKSDSQKQKKPKPTAKVSAYFARKPTPKYSSNGKSTVSKTVQIPSSNSEQSHKRRKPVVDDVNEEVTQLGLKDRTLNNEAGTFDLEFSQVQPNLPSNDGNPAKKQRVDIQSSQSEIGNSSIDFDFSSSQISSSFDLEFSQPFKPKENNTDIEALSEIQHSNAEKPKLPESTFDLEESQPISSVEVKPSKRIAHNKPHPRKVLRLPSKSTILQASGKRKQVFSYQPDKRIHEPTFEQSIEYQEKQLHKRNDIREKFYQILKDPNAVDVISQKLSDEPSEEQLGEISEKKTDNTEPNTINSTTDKQPGILSNLNPKKTLQTRKLTPMDQQYVDFKSKHPDLVLFFESGYQYRMFGMDAKLGAEMFKNVLRPGKLTLDPNNVEDAKYPKYATITLMEISLNKKIESLVSAGYKVGLIQQTETAASKAIESTNKRSLFERKLTKVYTKATMMDRDEYRNSEHTGSNYILAITGEEDDDDTNSHSSRPTSRSSKYRLGIVAVRVTTGEVVYDDFIDDDAIHTELENRLIHIQPSEILFVGKPRKIIRKLIKQLIVSKILTDDPRIDTITRKSGLESIEYVSNFYNKQVAAREFSNNSNLLESDNIGQKLDLIEKLSEPVQVCLAALIEYLKDFQLERAFTLTNNFSPFSSSFHMYLSGHTIVSLELFQNRTNFKPEGSLFYIIDYTKTKFGKRRLKQWIERPLIDRKAIEDRLDAAQELNRNLNAGISELLGLMSKVNDMEFILAKIYYKRCQPRQLYYFLLDVLRFSKTVTVKFSRYFKAFKSKHMRRIFNTISSAHGAADSLLSEIQGSSARENQLRTFFKDGREEYEEISDLFLETDFLTTDVNEHLKDMKETHKFKSLKYCEFLGKKYFMIDSYEASKIPDDWLLETKTKSFLRYRSPRLTELLDAIEYSQEQLDAKCEIAFQKFLDKVNQHYDKFHALVNAIGELDCFLSFAYIISHSQHYVRPKFVDTQCCDIVKGRHPMVELYNMQNTSYYYVPNDTHMSATSNRTMIITGPNMGGKSSYVRQIALIVIMAQIGLYVPAESATLGVVDAVYTRMGAYDNIMADRSTFQTELMECSDILRHATPKSLILLDEVGRGTGTMDGVAIAHAVLEYCICDIKALTLFITHYTSLTQISEKYPGNLAGTYHMDFEEEKRSDETDGNKSRRGFRKVIFKYNVVKGVVHHSYGLNVARLVELPDSVIEKAAIMADELKEQVTFRKNLRLAKDMCRFIKKMKTNQDAGDVDNTVRLTKEDIQALYRLFSNIPPSKVKS